MYLILSNSIVNTMHYGHIYMADNKLCLGNSTAVIVIDNVPSDALSKIAVAIVERREFVEFEDAVLMMEDTDGE